MKWKTFNFDGNQAWGRIDSPKEWNRIMVAYSHQGSPGSDAPLKSMRGRDLPDGTPTFGFQLYQSGETLAEWAGGLKGGAG